MAESVSPPVALPSGRSSLSSPPGQIIISDAHTGQLQHSLSVSLPSLRHPVTLEEQPGFFCAEQEHVPGEKKGERLKEGDEANIGDSLKTVLDPKKEV